MKIIKAGKLPPPVDIVEVFEGICYNCKAQVEAERSEVKLEDAQFFFAKCPTQGCQANIHCNLIRKEIPRSC